MEQVYPEGTRPPEYVVLWGARELRARNARIQRSLAEALTARKPPPQRPARAPGLRPRGQALTTAGNARTNPLTGQRFPGVAVQRAAADRTCPEVHARIC